MKCSRKHQPGDTRFVCVCVYGVMLGKLAEKTRQCTSFDAREEGESSILKEKYVLCMCFCVRVVV